LIFVLLLAVASCNADTPEAPISTARDSAGVRIIENTPADHLPVWQTSSLPLVGIGGDEGDPATIFTRISGGVRLADGRLIIADGLSRELRIFDSLGAHLRTVGGPGAGPGEFRSLWHLTRIHGDTLITSDWPIGTWNWFLPDGDFVRRTQVGLYFPGLAGPPLRDGSLLADAWERGSHGNEVEFWAGQGSEPQFRAEGYLVRIPRGAEAPDTLAPLSGPEWFKVGAPRRGLAVRPLPFGATTRVVAGDSTIFLADTRERNVRVLDFDGRVLRHIRWKGVDVPVTSKDRAATRDAVMSGLRQTTRRPDFERWLARVPFPETLPTIDQLVVDTEGRLWAQVIEPSGRDEWLVFNVEGELAARASIPKGLRILHIGPDHVLGVRQDELDVEYVELFGLIR